MCFFVPTSIFCPCCALHKPRIISVIRCASAVIGQCDSWERYYNNTFVPVTRRTIDFIDPLSDPPYGELSFFVRPCGPCTMKIARGTRLIIFEDNLRSRCRDEPEARAIFPSAYYLGGDHLTKALLGYRRIDYPSDFEYNTKTGPIYVPAVRCSSLSLPVAHNGEHIVHDGSALEEEVAALRRRGLSVEQYDALQYFEWSWELSSGSLYGGGFNRIEALPPQDERIVARAYDSTTEMWEHPFVGPWAELAKSAQLAPFNSRELSSILRTYTFNGVVCDRRHSFLAPDCFAHTIFSVDAVAKLVKAYAEARTRQGELSNALAENGGLLERSVVLTSTDVFRSRVWGDDCGVGDEMYQMDGARPVTGDGERRAYALLLLPATGWILHTCGLDPASSGKRHVKPPVKGFRPRAASALLLYRYFLGIAISDMRSRRLQGSNACVYKPVFLRARQSGHKNAGWKAIPKYQESNGEESIVGDCDVVHTDDMASEQSESRKMARLFIEARHVGGRLTVATKDESI
ncbi:hypothetical protein B0H11DRAFT_1912190 [Mycena galericulata]|nr:hypothetical protein B0H11DRAFT_1912190 [Mycena galericulata]